MTRSRKLTLSVREFSHLVSEALDVANNNPPSQSFVDHTLFSEASRRHRPQPSSFQRIFARPTPTPGQIDDPLHESPEDHFDTPRKMITWPFSRSPRKNRPSKDEAVTEVHDPAIYQSPYAITSPAATSTSSLGSLVPADERLFQVVSQDSDEPSPTCDLFSVSPSSSAATTSSMSGPPTDAAHYADAAPLHTIFGNSTATSSSRSVAEPSSDVSNRTWPSFEGTADSLSVANSERGSFDDDPTPRAASFGPQVAISQTDDRDDPLPVHRGRPQRLSLVVPSQSAYVHALRPVVGAAPHAPSETESSISVCTSPPTSPVARDASPTSSPMRPLTPGSSSPRVPPSTPPNLRTTAAFPSVASSSNVETAHPMGLSPRQRKRALSRSMTPPPLPRPPPTGPLPAIPSAIPPVPPLPPLLHKLSANMAPHSTKLSPPRSTMAGAPANPATALPPSPPGGLRLPSRLSWVNSVRAVLPSPPASPTKPVKSLSGKQPSPSPSKPEQRRAGELKRPTSIGIIEAADNAHVRRTKSILLLGSRSKSNASLGTKRVQIHADVNLEAAPSRKLRRKSSSATVSHPIFSSEAHARPIVSPMTSAELLVPRERRHSAPMLSMGRDVPGVSEDWTLSLPFCTDVPGNKIMPLPPLSTASMGPGKTLEAACEDWTLYMPLKVRVGTPTTEGSESECTTVTTLETAGEMQMQTTTAMAQLPTPSPSPTFTTPRLVVCSLPEGRVSVEEPERPLSPASLGPDVGGLDLAGRGKRASGWHVYGWFDEVNVSGEEVDGEAPCAVDMSDEMLSITTETDVVPYSMDVPDCYKKFAKNHVTAFRKAQGHPSQDSTSTVSTVFYSARSSIMIS